MRHTHNLKCLAENDQGVLTCRLGKPVSVETFRAYVRHGTDRIIAERRKVAKNSQTSPSKGVKVWVIQFFNGNRRPGNSNHTVMSAKQLSKIIRNNYTLGGGWGLRLSRSVLNLPGAVELGGAGNCVVALETNPGQDPDLYFLE